MVREKIKMRMVEKQRDIKERKKIIDFEDKVKKMERMKIIMIIKVCDIKEVGKGIWKGWKGKIMRKILYEKEMVMKGGF